MHPDSISRGALSIKLVKTLQMRQSAQSPAKAWSVGAHDAAQSENLRRVLRVTPVLARILASRGLCDPTQASCFLSCKLNELPDPSLIPGMTAAAAALLRAVRDGRRIVIYGDYDVDGITSICVLHKCLSAAGANVTHYLPDRINDGYGLHESSVEQIAAEGGKLLVTVDCGIRACEQVRRARELGLEVIVTDHHEPGVELPADAIVVNPKVSGPDAPGAELAGVGIAFKLAWAFAQAEAGGGRAKPNLRNLLIECMGLAALGTVVDVAPLIRENRILVRYGMEMIHESKTPGLAALLDVCRLADKTIQPVHLAFMLGPRLNAAGRLGSADKALRLLMTNSASEARSLALELEDANRQRRQIETQILKEVQERLEASEQGTSPVVVEAGQDWHEGVIGIVASKIADMSNRPTILFGWNGEHWRGSGRSVPGVHLLDLIEGCGELLTSFGGHAQAAGLRVSEAQLEPFRKRINELASEQLSPEKLAPTLHIDAEADFSELDMTVFRDIEQMAPFGEGNPAPVLASRNVRIAGMVNRMGAAGQHANFLVNKGNATFRVVAFRQGDLADIVSGRDGASFDIAYIPKVNEYKGRASPELELVDIRPSDRRSG
ncbi:MAG TPA: single-stranded-DNA-specific exonuclease RecJ [Candidatus Brocadiia bacterium]|nr:single-stranded-DNA-specific exonuclease RecJ [Candidatus Brocadiia bacterium]